jgi:hypothetical protein
LHPFMKASFVFEGGNATASDNQSNVDSSPVSNVSLSTNPDSLVTLVYYSGNSLVGVDYTSSILANKQNRIGF